MIDLVAYEDIDKEHYDRCVYGSDDFRVYATSSYLDAMARNWDALIYKDYKAVLPVPRRRKFGLNYVYTPAFVQQLGVFSSEKISAELEDDFYKSLRSKFILVDYAFHSGSRPKVAWQERVNYTLSLDKDYQDLFGSFNTNRKRIITKGFDTLTLEKSREPAYFLKHLDQTDLGFVPDAPLLEALNRVVDHDPDRVRTWNVIHEGQWIGGLLWLKDHRRITYLFPVANKKGKDLDAPTFILNNLIREHQGTDLLLDLEGSMIPGVARFYRSFGAQIETYYFMKSRLYGLF